MAENFVDRKTISNFAAQKLENKDMIQKTI
jgi:hypothetical protein